MKIKENYKFTPGDSFEWEVSIYDKSKGYKTNRVVSLVVKEVYDHHILCLMTQPPYLSFSIQNVDLLLGGVIKSEMVDRPIITESARLKFFDKGV